jgi:predicted metal-binding membrane protein
MSMTNGVVQTVVKRDRLIVLAGLAGIIFVAAIFTVNMALEFNRPIDVTLMHPSHSTLTGARGFLMLFTMWTVMQVAMMSPTAVPMLLMHAKIERRQQEQTVPYFSTALFFLGYVIVWGIIFLI